MYRIYVEFAATQGRESYTSRQALYVSWILCLLCSSNADASLETGLSAKPLLLVHNPEFKTLDLQPLIIEWCARTGAGG